MALPSCDRRFEFDVPDAGEEPSLPTPQTDEAPTDDDPVVPPPPAESSSAETDAPPSTTSPEPDAAPAASSPAPDTSTDEPPTGACATDADCGHSELHCDPGTGICFECVVDEQCGDPELPKCDPELQRCVECTADTDCASESICDLVVRRCQQHCLQRSDCPAGTHDCDHEVCVNCDSDRECVSEEAPHCGVGGTRCAECAADEHCVAPMVCDALMGVCVACRDSRDCDSGQACDPTTHACSE